VDPERSASSRVALVTGGASGLGLSICARLAQQHRRVAVLDLDGDAAQEVAARLRVDGAHAVGGEVDVSNRAAVDAAFENVRVELGPIEILVTSAAVSGFVPFEAISPAVWERTIAVNLTGTFNCLQSSIGDMASKGITANTIPPFTVDTPMLRGAQESNYLPNDDVLTRAIPAGRLGTGDDIAAVCAFLCSDEASYITGQVVAVNGGAVT
jgi:NAD(P)-dependent dehydrogenase (short-subunit alcohol dehydrogenase family)